MKPNPKSAARSAVMRERHRRNRARKFIQEQARKVSPK